MIKYRYLDYFAGFSLALMAAFPVIRESLITLPSIAMVLPVMFLYLVGVLKMLNSGTKILNWWVLGYVYFIFFLFIYLFLSGLWKIYDVNIREDIQKVFYILILVFGIIISFNKRATEIFLNWIIVFAVYTTMVYIFTYVSTASLRGWGVSAYLVKSMLIGSGALISISRLLFYKDISKRKYIFLSGFLLFGLAIAIGRASILFTGFLSFVLLFVYYIYNWPKSYSLTEYFKNKSALILIGISTGLVIFIISQIEKTASKFIRLFSGAELSGIRVEIWVEAFLGFLDSPIIGHGLSSSGAIVTLSYPHNLYLQIMVDGGAIGLFLLAVVSIYPYLAVWYSYINNKLNNKIIIPLITVYSFYLLNFSLATNFYEGRVLLAFGLLTVIVAHTESYTKNYSKRLFVR